MINTHFHCVGNGASGNDFRFIVSITPADQDKTTERMTAGELQAYIETLREDTGIRLGSLRVNCERAANLKFAEYLELVFESAREGGYVT